MSDGSMQDTNGELKPILDYLMEKRGFDFSGYHPPMLERRLRQRLTATAAKDFKDYLSFLQGNEKELDHLLDVLTINISRFFRDSLTFELIADRVLPNLIQEKIKVHGRSLRVWSAGCAKGEEAYSLAILIRELLEKEKLEINLHLFATDIDRGVLKAAEQAVYPPASVENMKHRLLMKYFTTEGASYRLISEIKKLVTFSAYDMLDKKNAVPPESVFGDFDLILCRNLLIYFNIEYQNTICAKLYRSLTNKGILVLGEAEAPTITYQRHYSRVYDFSPIYRKR